MFEKARVGLWTIAVSATAFLGAIAMLMILSHRSEKLPYQDQFASGRMDEWTAFGGNWHLGNGYLSNDSDDTGAKVIAGSEALRDYRITSDVRLTNESGDTGLLVRVTSAEEGTNAFDGYYAGLRIPNQLLLGKMDFGFLPLARVSIDQGVKPGVWYRLSVIARECTIVTTATTLDGRQLATASANDPEHCDDHGSFGLRSFAAGGSWKNISVEAVQ